MRSNKNNNDTNRREKERERVRETSFSLSRDRKNALLSALLRVCAGVRKKTILINLIIKQEQKTFYLFWIFASLDFLRSSFWTVFLKVTSRPQFFLKSYEDMNTESKNKNNNNENNKSPTPEEEENTDRGHQVREKEDFEWFL